MLNMLSPGQAYFHLLTSLYSNDLEVRKTKWAAAWTDHSRHMISQMLTVMYNFFFINFLLPFAFFDKSVEFTILFCYLF